MFSVPEIAGEESHFQPYQVYNEKGGKTDGHHTEKVSENPDKMTDPRTIEFKKQEDHIKYHQQNGY